jgi:enoyl-CoA hydratase/carnithine racemase
MQSDHQTLVCARHGAHVLVVTLNRPEASNAVNTRMGQELVAVFEGLAMDADDVRCVVLTGAGDKAFCAGGDLKERRGMSDGAWAAQHLVFERAARALLGCPVPVIGAINGAAYGGGCEMAAACDFLYAAPHARFALTETSLGIIPGMGGTQTLTRALGAARAKELILSARPFGAEQAAAWGLVNHVAAPGALMEDALATAGRIASNAPIAVRQAKRAIESGRDMALPLGLQFEIEAYNRTVPTEDRREGVLAFNEKRPPRFTGR